MFLTSDDPNAYTRSEVVVEEEEKLGTPYPLLLYVHSLVSGSCSKCVSTMRGQTAERRKETNRAIKRRKRSAEALETTLFALQLHSFFTCLTSSHSPHPLLTEVCTQVCHAAFHLIFM